MTVRQSSSDRRGRAGTEAKDPKGHQGPPPSQLEERTQEVTWSPGSLSGSLLSRSPCSYFRLPSGSLCPGAGRSSHSNLICEREEKFKEAGQAEAPPDSPHPTRGNGLEATLSPRRLHMLVSSVPVEDFEHARAGSPSCRCTLPIHVASVKTRRREQTLADPVTPHLQLRASDFLVKYVLPVSVAGTSSRSLPAREGCYY